MQKYMVARRLVLYGMLIALAACGGGSVAPSPTPTPPILCSFFGPPPFTLVSPAPGAANVPDSTEAMLFTGTLETQYGPPGIKVTFAPQGFYLTDIFTATASGYSVVLPPLNAATTYTVYYVVDVATGTGPCTTVSIDEGSFTTQ
jgi:hypothetical protein